MAYVIVGLGNPGEKYENTRHNAGRIILNAFRKNEHLPDFEFDKKLNALICEGKIGKEKILLLEPETFMNNSGKSIKSIIKTKKDANHLVVIHDDVDLPIGSHKISFNKNSGGHRGVESIIRATNTTEFIRVRVGVSPTTPSGKIKKPKGEKAFNDFIVGSFKPSEMESIKKLSKKLVEAIEVIVKEGKDMAMSQYN